MSIYYRLAREVPGLYSVPGLVDRIHGASPFVSKDGGTWAICSSTGRVMARYLTLADARMGLVDHVQAGDFRART